MNITFEGLKATHGDKAEDVYNQISDLAGAGLRATGFNSNEGGFNVDNSTPNFDKIKSLLGTAKTEDSKKDGK